MTDMSLQAGQGRTYKWFTGEPTFAFGSGVSYTSFVIDLQPQARSNGKSVAPPSTRHNGLRYSVNVTNIGAVAGAEVVLVFARVVQLEQEKTELNADVPVKQLCAFDRTPVLPPGAHVCTYPPHVCFNVCCQDSLSAWLSCDCCLYSTR
eukprot:COSAG02_NODE_10520_length_1923_cov_2.024123_1_plen_149_part_00